MPGPQREFTTDDVLTYLKNGGRPVYSVANVAEFFGVTRPPAQDRLEELAEAGAVAHISIGGTKAYFIPGEDAAPEEPVEADLDREAYHRRSLRNWGEDRFVGLQHYPWTAVHPNDGPAKAGDKVQLQVEGEPGDWYSPITWTWDNRRDDLNEEAIPEDTQALISGTLYEKPTTPIEHIDYPDDYDLESKLGAEIRGEPPEQALIAAGLKNHWLRPANDAVFLKDVSVDWISPKGEGQTVEDVEISEDLLEDVEEWRQEHIEETADSPESRGEESDE